MSVWCLDSCPHCDRVVEGTATYCSPACEAAACTTPDQEDDDQCEDPMYSSSYASWHRISAWAQNVSPTPPLSTPIYLSPSKRILTPQYPTACLTSDSTISSNPSPSHPRPTRKSPTATESLVASSTAPPSPISFGGLVRSWAPKPHLPRLTTANFTVFAKTHPSAATPSDETETSDGDVSPVWWVSAAEQDSPRSGPPKHFVLQRGAPHPSRGRKPTRVIS